jgi:adenosyl cobinamide kinase/adenosyl cobinamide phosphate guanylyltransferase
MKRTVEEALVILFKGQSNVKLMANEVGISLVEMQQLFREYVARTPIDEDVWRGDVDMAWPYIT